MRFDGGKTMEERMRSAKSRPLIERNDRPRHVATEKLSLCYLGLLNPTALAVYRVAATIQYRLNPITCE